MKRFLPLILLALLAAALAASFTLEKRDRDLGYGREAQLNPWLAAGRLLEMRGLVVRFAPAYSHLPPRAKIIVLATPLELLDAKEQLALLNWVRTGGHLVTGLQRVSHADAASDESDLLYTTLDVKLREQESIRPEIKIPTPGMSMPTSLRPTQVADEGEIRTDLDAAYFLEAGRINPVWSISSAGKPHLLRFRLGDGRVTVLSDMAWMQNRLLGQGDHGALLWRMVDAHAPDEAWLIHGEDRPSLFALLRASAAPLLLSVAAFVLVWLWQASRRFGPVQIGSSEQRRRLGEHLQASGRYLLRHHATAQLLDASRQRLLTQVQRRYPQWRRLPAEKLAQHLSERAGLESAAILRVLGSTTPDNLLQFTADIRLLNRLRKAL